MTANANFAATRRAYPSSRSGGLTQASTGASRMAPGLAPCGAWTGRRPRRRAVSCSPGRSTHELLRVRHQSVERGEGHDALLDRAVAGVRLDLAYRGRQGLGLRRLGRERPGQPPCPTATICGAVDRGQRASSDSMRLGTSWNLCRTPRSVGSVRPLGNRPGVNLGWGRWPAPADRHGGGRVPPSCFSASPASSSPSSSTRARR